MYELIAACGAWVWVFVLDIPDLHKWFRRKPFNCEVCLSGWFTLCLCAGRVYWLEVPFRMAAAMVVTILLTNLMRKL